MKNEGRAAFRACAVAVSLGVVLALTAIPRAATAVTPAGQHAAPSGFVRDDIRVHAEGLWDERRADDCLAYLDSVAAAGRARHDASLAFSARLWRARFLVLAGQDSAASALLDTLDREARASGSAAAKVWILDNRTQLALTNAGPAGSLAPWRKLARAAHEARVDYVEGKALWSVAGNLISLGRFAEALPLLRSARSLLPPDSKAAMVIPLNMGQAYRGLGLNGSARASYREGMERCRAHNRLQYVRYYCNDLAVLEFDENDPAAALPYLEEALELPRLPGDSLLTLEYELNRAMTLYQIGPPERGLAELRPLQAACERTGQPTLITDVHAYLAQVYSEQGEVGPALQHARRALESARQSNVESQMTAANVLARLQWSAGWPEAALATIDSTRLDHPEQKIPSQLLEGEILRTEILLGLGRLDEAETAARKADRMARPDGPLKGSHWQAAGALLARVNRERGRPDSALALLHRLRGDWERRRDSIARDDLRENRGSSAGALFAELGLTLLDPRRRPPSPCVFARHSARCRSSRPVRSRSACGALAFRQGRWRTA